MNVWMIRGGGRGEHDDKFLNDARIYLTWHRSRADLSGASDKAELREILARLYPGIPPGRLRNNLGQFRSFVQKMQRGDIVLMPRRIKKGFIAVGEIAGDYEYDHAAADPYYHSRRVKWLDTDVPRANFDQEMRFSLSVNMTLCQVRVDRAPERVRLAMRAQSARAAMDEQEPSERDEADEGLPVIPHNIDELARDQIKQWIIQRLKGHGLAGLVDDILKAQGFHTLSSDPGPDGGVDILAAPAPLGFGHPRLCVQVKSGAGPIERSVRQQLQGVMAEVKAEQGLLVSWGGFRRTFDQEERRAFFNIRLWDSEDVIDQLFAHYGRLPEERRAEIPLKQIWTIATDDESDQ